MKVKVTSCTASLTKLRTLTEDLIDRDLSRLKDITLFEHFLQNSPIRICLWTIDADLKTIHQKCICPASKDQAALTQKFFEGSFKDELLNHHQSFLSEELDFKQLVIGNDEEIYAVTLKKEGQQINGAAVEITSRVRMLHILFGIAEENKESNPELSVLIRKTISDDHFSLLILNLLGEKDA